MTREEWRKLLYLHAVKIAKASSPQELRDATRAGETIARLAVASGIKLDDTEVGAVHDHEQQPGTGPYDLSARKTAAWIARNGPPPLRDDQRAVPEVDADEATAIGDNDSKGSGSCAS